MNADGTMSPHEIPHYLHYLESGYDFVKGSRFIAGGDYADYPLSRRLGHRALLRVARRLYGQHLTDLWYGFCAFRRPFVGLLDLREDGVELGAELVAHALHYGLRVAEVPSLELPRRHGPSHPGRSGTARASSARSSTSGRTTPCRGWHTAPSGAPAVDECHLRVLTLKKASFQGKGRPDRIPAGPVVGRGAM
ncbi:hypothetical protein O1L60_03390 [Streptomyces diastatochromogenes]|nr:hypothetical protein [Streptomyces diastatochromogenes]